MEALAAADTNASLQKHETPQSTSKLKWALQFHAVPSLFLKTRGASVDARNAGTAPESSTMTRISANACVL